jgi:hypothetical protein
VDLFKKMAMGGFVPGRGMTQIEASSPSKSRRVWFVSRGAANHLLSFLSSINDAKYPSMMGREMNSPVYSVAAPSTNIADANKQCFCISQ